MEGDLPDELIFEILSRLPSKSLLRCRSVCKSWLSLISSSEFKLFHLQNFNQLNPHNLIRRFELMQNKDIYSVHFDDEALTVDSATVIEFPFSCNPCTNNYLRLIGYYNGVVCLSHDKCIYKENKIILWNPSIRRKLTLYPPKIHLSHLLELFVENFVAFGFGYDQMTQDYKVVRLAYNYHILISKPQVHVYTVKTAIWKTVAFPCDLPSMYLKGSPVFLNGCVHWIAYNCWTKKVLHCSILKFDMSTELFGEIQLPKLLDSESPMILELALVRDQLVVIYSKRCEIGKSKYIMWAMKEYENPTSWTLIYNMCYETDLGRVLRLRNNGELIMGSRYGTVTMREYHLGYYEYMCRGFIVEDSIYIDKYQESLALLDIGQDVLTEDRRVEERSDE